MTKQTNNYEDMDNERKAQVIYNKLLQDDPKTLSEVLMELSAEYSDDDRVFTVEDWLEYFSEEPSKLATLVKIAQKSNGLNVEDEYIRESIYYTGYQTSDDILELVDKDEAVEWIANALEDNSPYIKDLETGLITNYSYLKGDF